jgi:hypothetical protein
MKLNAICVGLSILGCLACSSSHKSLTQATGQSLIQSEIEKPSSGMFLLDYSAVLPFMGKETYQNYATGAYSQPELQMMQRLIQSGLVAQHASAVSLPDVSGTYAGRFSNYEEFNPVTLVMRQDSPAVSGTYVERQINTASPGVVGCEGAIAGHVNENNTVTLTFFNAKVTCGCITPDETTFSIGQSELRDVIRTATGNNYILDLSGKRTGGEIRIERYRYDFTPKFLEMAKTRNNANGGSVEVVDVESILLGPTETSAETQFHWRVALNPVGKAIAGKNEITGEGSAEFRKTAEGEWVCTRASM